MFGYFRTFILTTTHVTYSLVYGTIMAYTAAFRQEDSDFE